MRWTRASKATTAGSATVFGRGEVDYYVRSFVGLAQAPLVHCHHAEADETHYVLLLDDLTESHRNQDDVPVTEAYGRSLVESLAQLHAHRWAQPPPDAAGIAASLRDAQSGLPVMLGAMQEGFSAAETDTVREVLTLCRTDADSARVSLRRTWCDDGHSSVVANASAARIGGTCRCAQVSAGLPRFRHAVCSAGLVATTHQGADHATSCLEREARAPVRTHQRRPAVARHG
jgi:hypothetical protein